jgi:hypothetical protein
MTELEVRMSQAISDPTSFNGPSIDLIRVGPRICGHCLDEHPCDCEVEEQCS